jgi:hypothetical protein
VRPSEVSLEMIWMVHEIGGEVVELAEVQGLPSARGEKRGSGLSAMTA